MRNSFAMRAADLHRTDIRERSVLGGAEFANLSARRTSDAKGAFCSVNSTGYPSPVPQSFIVGVVRRSILERRQMEHRWRRVEKSHSARCWEHEEISIRGGISVSCRRRVYLSEFFKSPRRQRARVEFARWLIRLSRKYPRNANQERTLRLYREYRQELCGRQGCRSSSKYQLITPFSDTAALRHYFSRSALKSLSLWIRVNRCGKRQRQKGKYQSSRGDRIGARIKYREGILVPTHEKSCGAGE